MVRNGWMTHQIGDASGTKSDWEGGCIDFKLNSVGRKVEINSPERAFAECMKQCADEGDDCLSITYFPRLTAPYWQNFWTGDLNNCYLHKRRCHEDGQFRDGDYIGRFRRWKFWQVHVESNITCQQKFRSSDIFENSTEISIILDVQKFQILIQRFKFWSIDFSIEHEKFKTFDCQILKRSPRTTVRSCQTIQNSWSSPRFLDSIFYSALVPGQPLLDVDPWKCLELNLF